MESLKYFQYIPIYFNSRHWAIDQYSQNGKFISAKQLTTLGPKVVTDSLTDSLTNKDQLIRLVQPIHFLHPFHTFSLFRSFHPLNPLPRFHQFHLLHPFHGFHLFASFAPFTLFLPSFYSLLLIHAIFSIHSIQAIYFFRYISFLFVQGDLCIFQFQPSGVTTTLVDKVRWIEII